jgi:aminopeptidase S
MTLDADVISPDTSENLVIKIPGEDTSRSIMLGAHIDSTNNPGAMDDGSGSVVLLSVAKILNDNEIRPPVNLYLSWFGSEEIGLMGSRYYANTHPEILDNLMAMVEIDSLMRRWQIFTPGSIW